MRHDDAFFLLENLRSVVFILPYAGKTISFNMADLGEFVKEIQNAQCFDSILARLLFQNFEKITIQFEDQMKSDCSCVKNILNHQ